MNVVGVLTCIVMAMLLLVLSGCRSADAWRETVGNDTTMVDVIAHKTDHPVTEIHPAAWSGAPTTLRDCEDLESIQYRDMTLDEALHIALQNSQVLRDLGARIIDDRRLVPTRQDRAIAVTDPNLSPEAALSAFDAQFRTSAFFSNNDQLYNNPFFAGGTNAFKQDLHEYEAELSKITATGSQLALRSISIHNANNAPGNIFRSAWDTYVEGEIRKPLLQGGGIQFNRIAGPGSTPGKYNGVLLAKVNADMVQTDFEVDVRNYVNDVTNAYWDLYFAYRDLDAKSDAMKRALEVWNRIKAAADSGLLDAADEALARAQYYRFKSEVDEALSGRVSQGTQTGSGGRTGGTFAATEGVQTMERRLRLLIGITISDGEMIRPADEPLEADVIFDWDVIQNDALRQRPELRKQQMAVRGREMELLAARNFLNPRLDAVGRYRFRGFGDDLVRTENVAGRVPSSALRNLMGGTNQEWFVGFEYEVPIGYRKAHLAVSNAELLLTRERAIHREQQRKVIHDLTNAVADAARAYQKCQNSLNQLEASTILLNALEAKDENGMALDDGNRIERVDRLLDAQRRVVEAQIRYFRARTEYAVALKNVHLEKGSLLPYHNLHIFNNRPVSASRHVQPPTKNVAKRPAKKQVESQTESRSKSSPEAGQSAAASNLSSGTRLRRGEKTREQRASRSGSGSATGSMSVGTSALPALPDAPLPADILDAPPMQSPAVLAPNSVEEKTSGRLTQMQARTGSRSSDVDPAEAILPLPQ